MSGVAQHLDYGVRSTRISKQLRRSSLQFKYSQSPSTFGPLESSISPL